MNKKLKDRLAQAQSETGFSIKGFSRRDFAIMAIICQEVLLDEDLLETVAPLSKFDGIDTELTGLAEKINDFLDV